MNFGSIIVLVVLTAVVGAVCAKLIRDKKSGKTICGGDCSKCHGCTHSEK